VPEWQKALKAVGLGLISVRRFARKAAKACRLGGRTRQICGSSVGRCRARSGFLTADAAGALAHQGGEAGPVAAIAFHRALGAA